MKGSSVASKTTRRNPFLSPPSIPQEVKCATMLKLIKLQQMGG